MRSCPYCSSSIKENWSYCPYCNKPLITNINNELKGSLHDFYNKFSTHDEQKRDEEKGYYKNNLKRDWSIERKLQMIEIALKDKEIIGESIPGSLLLERASLYYKKRDFSNAIKNLESALKNFTDVNDVLNIAICHNELGIIQEDMGYFDQAIYHFNLALDTLKDLKDNVKTIKILNNLGNVYYLIKDLENSYKYYQKALTLSEKEGLEIEEVIVEEVKTASNLVEVLFLLKDFERIKKILKRNSEFFQYRKDIYGIIQTHIKYGKFYYIKNGDYERSFQSFNDALLLIEKIKDTISIFARNKLEWECYLYLGKIYREGNNSENAENLMLKSLEAVRTFEVGEDLREGIVLENLANLFQLKENYSKSIEYYILAIEIYKKYGDKSKIAELKSKIAIIYSESFDDTARAIEFFEQALDIFENLNVLKESAEILQYLGDISLKLKDIDLALANFEKSKSYYHELKDEYNVNILKEKIDSLKIEQEKG